MVTCCMRKCSNSRKSKCVKFHRFPFNNKDKLEKWINYVQQELCDKDWTPKESSRICSLHFATTAYIELENFVPSLPFNICTDSIIENENSVVQNTTTHDNEESVRNKKIPSIIRRRKPLLILTNTSKSREKNIVSETSNESRVTSNEANNVEIQQDVIMQSQSEPNDISTVTVTSTTDYFRTEHDYAKASCDTEDVSVNVTSPNTSAQQSSTETEVGQNDSLISKMLEQHQKLFLHNEKLQKEVKEQKKYIDLLKIQVEIQNGEIEKLRNANISLKIMNGLLKNEKKQKFKQSKSKVYFISSEKKS